VTITIPDYLGYRVTLRSSGLEDSNNIQIDLYNRSSPEDRAHLGFHFDKGFFDFDSKVFLDNPEKSKFLGTELKLFLEELRTLGLNNAYRFITSL